MKISVMSDFHFGFGKGSELEEDPFENASEAMEEATKDSDLIIIAGDIFDTPLPRTQTWAKALQVLVKPLLQPSTGVRMVECTKPLREISKRTLSHVPVIALHGNHERRAKGEFNAVQALENAGILIHLHGERVVFEKDGTKVAIHGMSSVPERFARDFLVQWNPRPLEGCVNILLLHQNIDKFVYSPEEGCSLRLEDLPQGFELIVNGHVHSSAVERLDEKRMLILPGSTVVTQFEKEEASREKGFFKVEVEGGRVERVEFVPLKNCRKFFYEEVEVRGESVATREIEKVLGRILLREFKKPPVVKIRLKGEEEKVFDRELRELERRYGGRLVLKFSKELESREIEEKVEFLRELKESRVSLRERGLEVLRKNLEELGFRNTFDFVQVFELLSEGEVEKTMSILLGEQKTLASLLKKSAVG